MVSRKNDTLRACRFLIGAALSLLWVSCAGAQLRTGDISIETAGGTSVPLRVEFAISQAEQEKGYMTRKTIPDGTGMVFAYKSDQVMRFWMKNTPHSLSIAFISSDGTIHDIFDMRPFSLDVVSSSGSVRYALEVPQGWFARAGIVVGDRLSAASLAAIERLGAGN
jgi:uncharacterized membrane protein (UPF0127 family)